MPLIGVPRVGQCQSAAINTTPINQSIANINTSDKDMNVKEILGKFAFICHLAELLIFSSMPEVNSGENF